MACRPVLSAANGPVPAEVLLIGEAPGRFGAGRTGVPFLGDEAGRRFELLLAAAGLTRAEVFISNAILCLPLDSRARNRTPNRGELANCAPWLSRTIDVVAPQLVVAIGRVALEALRRIAPHGLQLSDAGRPPVEWGARRLAVAYHPGARAQVHRSWDDQLDDWRALGEWLVESRDERRTLRP
jgi:uracil-DNA glycosylase family 4